MSFSSASLHSHSDYLNLCNKKIKSEAAPMKKRKDREATENGEDVEGMVELVLTSDEMRRDRAVSARKLMERKRTCDPIIHVQSPD